MIAWSDAFANAALDPGLDEMRILDAYDARCPRRGVLDRFVGRFIDQTVIRIWLGQLRSQLRGNSSKYDLARSGAELLDATVMPAGPSRTRPFRSVVRNVLNFPGEANAALSKVPLAFDQSQRLRPWSQFDGSIHRPVVRSMIAAFTSGSTLTALAIPAVEQSIRAAAEYTLALGAAPRAELFRSLSGSATSIG